MKSTKSKTVKLSPRSSDNPEFMDREDLLWLADFRRVLSPYWSSRVEYQKGTDEKDKPVLVLEGTQNNKALEG